MCHSWERRLGIRRTKRSHSLPRRKSLNVRNGLQDYSGAMLDSIGFHPIAMYPSAKRRRYRILGRRKGSSCRCARHKPSRSWSGAREYSQAAPHSCLATETRSTPKCRSSGRRTDPRRHRAPTGCEPSRKLAVCTDSSGRVDSVTLLVSILNHPKATFRWRHSLHNQQTAPIVALRRGNPCRRRNLPAGSSAD